MKQKAQLSYGQRIVRPVDQPIYRNIYTIYDKYYIYCTYIAHRLSALIFVFFCIVLTHKFEVR